MRHLQNLVLPNSFIKWVKTLYKNFKGCMLNNGWISETNL